MSVFLVRAAIVALLPIMLAWAFFARMARESRHALLMAWLDMRWEISDARWFWRDGRFPSSIQRMKDGDE